MNNLHIATLDEDQKSIEVASIDMDGSLSDLSGTTGFDFAVH